MQARFSSIFGSYDLFAKAFPGTVFFLLFLSLLPESGFDINLSQSGSLIAALIVLTLVMGFGFGQAVHSIAVQIESGFYIITNTYYRYINLLSRLYKLIKIIILSKLIPEKGRADPGESGSEEFKLSKFDIFRISAPVVSILILGIISGKLYLYLGAFVSGIVVSAIAPLNRLRSWGSQFLVPHRRQFEDRVKSQVPDKENDMLVDRFTVCISDVFDHSEETTSLPDIEATYTLAMSHLEYIGGGRARQFQAIFSFCRSMWATLLIYSLPYMLLGIQWTTGDLPLVSDKTITWLNNYQPIIMVQVGGRGGMLTVGLAMFVSVFLFMEGERQYKSLFVDYVLADFITSTNDQTP